MAGFTKKGWSVFTICLIFAAILITCAIPYAGTGDCKICPKKRPSVHFLDNYHDSHMDNFECLDCHHKYINGKNVLNEDDLEEGNPNILCSSCHNDNSKIGLRQAFHTKCIGCHDKLSAKGEKTGPSMCGECHERKGAVMGSLVHGGISG